MSDKLSRRDFVGAATSIGGLAAIAGCTETGDDIIGGPIGSGPGPLEIPSSETVTIESGNKSVYSSIRWESGGTLAWESGGRLRLEAATEGSE